METGARAVLVASVNGEGEKSCAGFGAGDPLAPPVGYLACLFLALRRLTAHPGGHSLVLNRIASVVITGGAWAGTTDTRWSPHVDRS